MYKKILIYFLVFILSFSNVFSAVNTNTGNCIDHSVKGFAWSDTIGWISFDCKSAGSDINYGVDVDKNGYLSGEAWSDSLGWISFDYYTTENSRPIFNKVTKKLEGYVKVLSGLEKTNDGFSGKISLSGVADNGYNYAPVYNPTTYEFDEYAWGSSVIGWIDFKTSYGVVTMDPFNFTFTSNKGTAENPVPYNGSVILSWSTDGAVSCLASDGTGTTWLNHPNKSVGYPSVSTETVANLEEDIDFSLTCSNMAGNSVTKTLNIRVAPPAPELFLYASNDNIASGTSTIINWNVKNVENCVATSSSNTWTGLKNSTNGIHSNSSGNLSESINWFKLSCDSNNPDYYPDGIEALIYVNVEKLELEFYPENEISKFNDKIKLYWRPKFAVSCFATGDLIDFNGPKDFSSGLHTYESSQQNVEDVAYSTKMECTGTIGQKIQKEIHFKVGKNPKYQEI